MIDFHCHLDLYPDALKLARQVSLRNEFTFVVTTSPRAFEATSRVFSGFPGVHVGLGLHPEVAQGKAAEKQLLVKLISTTTLVGEIGLDGSSRFKQTLPLQQDIFESAIAECERQGGRLMGIHSRGAASLVLDHLQEHPGCGTPVLHWFSGSPRELQRAVDAGCWFSVGPAMLASQTGRTLAAQMPLERILPETDGPFATANGKPLMPWQASDVSAFFGELHGKSEPEIRAQFRKSLGLLIGRDDSASAARKPL